MIKSEVENMKGWIGRFSVLLAGLFVMGAFAVSAAGISWSIYLYGNRLDVPYFVRGNQIYVERSAFLEAAGLRPDYVFPGEPLEENGMPFVSLADAARGLHSFLLINRQTGIVDIYKTPTQIASASSGPLVVIPPSAYEEWQNVSPISHLPLNPLPPPAVNIEPLVGNPWYRYPPYAPDPYYGASNPGLYNSYASYPIYYPVRPGTVPPPTAVVSSQPGVHMSGGFLPEDSRFLPPASATGCLYMCH